MKRIMDEPDIVKRLGGSTKNLNPSNPLKALEGSERQIVDPLVSRIKDTHAIIAMAERNRVMSNLANDLQEASGKGIEGFEDVKVAKTPMNATEMTPAETAKVLKKQGFDPQDAKDLANVETIFRASRAPLADDQIAYFENGKRIVLEGVPPEIVNVVRDMDSKSTGLLMKTLATPSMLLREGMMTSPMFAFRHFFRQELLASSLSKDLHLPVIETVKGLSGMMGDSKEEFGDWIMHGGGGDSVASIDNDYIKSKVFDLNEETGFLDNAWNKAKTVLQSAKHAIELTDEARTFQKYRNRLASGDVSDPFQAQFQARDTGIDVQRSGANIGVYSKLFPFQNIRLQGLDLIARRIAEDPMSVVPKLMASITIPAATLWYLNHDKDWYKNLTDQDRDTNFHFAVGDPDKDGHVIRVPKPFEPGIVFGALPERLMDAFFTDNPHAFKNFEKTITDSIMPGYIPTFAQPAIEAFANKSMLTGAPLIPHNMENIPPQYQSNPYTSDAAKIIASGIRQIPLAITQKPGTLASPIIVDNFIKNWTGGVGQLVLYATDKALEKSGVADAAGIDYNHNPPESVWSDNPFLRSFVVRYPSTNTKQIGDFFDRYNDVQTELNGLKFLKQKGDFTNLQKETASAAAEGNLIKLDGYKKAISEQMGLIQKITVMPGMDPNQKRQQIDALAKTVNQVATVANQFVDEVEKQTSVAKGKK